jgi:hypothetical protein
LEKGVDEKDFKFLLLISIYFVFILGIYDSSSLGVKIFYFD